MCGFFFFRRIARISRDTHWFPLINPFLNYAFFRVGTAAGKCFKLCIPTLGLFEVFSFLGGLPASKKGSLLPLSFFLLGSFVKLRGPHKK